MRPAILLPVLAAMLAGCGPVAAAEPPVVWRVVSVHDGDTLTALDGDNVQHKVRLAGIDAPERGQPFGTKARDGLAGMTMGKAVAVHVTDRDKYGRTVARIEVEGQDVNRAMVAAGLAWHYTRYSKAKALEEAEAEARAARRGLWADREPVPPWEWRATEKERKRVPAGR
jgi:endonuclease YncB( thermonuclease family)